MTAPGRPRPVASVLHTAIVLGILVALAWGGVSARGRGTFAAAEAGPHASHLALYLTLVAAEWGLVLYVRAGIRRQGVTLSELVGGRWNTPIAVIRDVLIAAGFWIVFELSSMGMHRLSGGDTSSVSGMLPRGGLESVLWTLLSISAGFSEELLFRGYLLRQAWAFSGSRAIAVLAQAVGFGLAHGYQGLASTAVIAVLGLLFGLLAVWRDSLRPGILAHAWADVFGGLLSRAGR